MKCSYCGEDTPSEAAYLDADRNSICGSCYSQLLNLTLRYAGAYVSVNPGAGQAPKSSQEQSPGYVSPIAAPEITRTRPSPNR
jgi:hypothetical protein